MSAATATATATAPAPTAGGLSPAARTAIKVVVWVAVVGVLYWVPQYFTPVQVGLFTKVIALAFAALGLNLLTGYSGLISVGHGAFMGVGAYTTAILVADHGWSHGAALVASAAAAFVLGVLIGLPALRIKGLYLALVTLALATLFPEVVKRYGDVTGGTQGLRVPKFKAPEATDLANDQWIYYVAVVLLVLSFVAVRNLVHSRVGRALIASRDNETAAETMGVHLSAYRVVVFGISAMLAGMGGAVNVWQTNFVDPGQFGIVLSITVLVAVVVGGAATILGPAVGAYLVVWLPNGDILPPAVMPDLILKDNPELIDLVFGAALIALMMLAPYGLVGGIKLALYRLKQRRAVAAAGKAPPGGGEPAVSTA
ncbi:MAG: branched-chain amino acid ABC transporter permease [Acidimicrobiales bacterium]|jgi:branched-chain amino acid transport system permease protein|nr:branched-chain amino acid ABC transporter permease [Acidimicrobiales bacterium]